MANHVNVIAVTRLGQPRPFGATLPLGNRCPKTASNVKAGRSANIWRVEEGVYRSDGIRNLPALLNFRR